MVEIQAGGAVVAVVTALGKSFRARHLVIAAGAWTAGLCSSIGLNLPFRVHNIMSPEIPDSLIQYVLGRVQYTISVFPVPRTVTIGIVCTYAGNGTWA